MAWNNGYQMNVPTQNFMNYQPQTQNVMQNTFMPIVVRDKSEAESYPMAANTTISMRDESFTHMWIKSTNASGTVVAFRTFTVTIQNTSAQPILVQNANIIFSRPDLAVTR